MFTYKHNLFVKKYSFNLPTAFFMDILFTFMFFSYFCKVLDAESSCG